MDRFSYFIVFYSLILGLALAELLGGFALMVRAHALKKLEAQTALIAILTLVCIVTNWVDAWNSLKSVTVDLAGLTPPVLLAICYYLAAAVVFPHREADHERLADYYQERRSFIIVMLVTGELLGNVMYARVWVYYFDHQPAVFWVWLLPYNVAIVAATSALLFVRSRWTNILLLAIAILLLILPYWEEGYPSDAIARHYGYR